jgi:alcohol dehydrogenase
VLAQGHIGVHGKLVELSIEKLWSHNITLTTRLVDTVTTPMLLKVVESRRLDPTHLVTHRFGLAEILKAHDVLGNAAKERALKVILKSA